MHISVREIGARKEFVAAPCKCKCDEGKILLWQNEMGDARDENLSIKIISILKNFLIKV